jgi:hypothetical protein
MKKVYMSEKNYTELKFFGYTMGRKYNYEKLFEKKDKIICRTYVFELGNELDESGLYKVEKKFVEDVAVVKRS